MNKIGEFELNKIYCMDCLEFMKKLPDKCIDLILTDPPYGIDYGGMLKGKGDGNGGSDKNGWKDWGSPEWDRFRPSEEHFKEILRVSKNQIIWGGNYFSEFLPSKMCWLVWDKGQRGFSLADGELAWTSFNKALRIFTYARGKFMNDINESREHPTQKPIKLGYWMLDKLAQDGDLIFDPFAGSGSFLIACKHKGFNFIGCEINEDYVKIANKRLSQQTLYR